jgi:hypothetical protein
MMGTIGRLLLKATCVAACLLVSGCIVEDRELNANGGNSTGGECTLINEGPCRQCIVAACPDACTGCQNNPQCIPLITCLYSCSDDSCAIACEQSYPGGVPPMSVLYECVQNSCSSECGSVTG